MVASIEQMVIKASESLKEALNKINLNAQGLLFVLDDEGKLCGTITDGDVRRALLDGIDTRAPVSRAMSKDFYFCIALACWPNWILLTFLLFLQMENWRIMPRCPGFEESL